ncbi:hypothetical protein BN1200_280066 [Klebsiella variicola]|nr:hypothetical protein NUKP18_03490 [Klebsiella variicola]CTQ08654.1 hypothetical protein BN1200_280066 [Klebsiella variicola]
MRPCSLAAASPARVLSRREGASRLFEAGFSIEEVAQVTGRRSLNILWQVYTELFPKTLHDKFNRLQKEKISEIIADCTA